MILFLGEMLTATAMGYFEDEIAKAVVLALFVPLIISSGGNSGSQASTIIIRAMALGEFRLGGLVEDRPTRGHVRARAGSDPRIDRLHADRPVERILDDLRSALGAGRLHGRALAGGVVLWGTLSGSMLPFILRRLEPTRLLLRRRSSRRWST